MSEIKWDDLNAFAKDALTYANEAGYVMALDDDDDDEGYEYEGWSNWVIWKLAEQGLLMDQKFQANLYRITEAGRALVASQSAGENKPAEFEYPAEMPIKELIGKSTSFCQHYCEDEDDQFCYILEVIPDPNHDGKVTVYYYDGHGGQRHHGDVDPESAVHLLHYIELSQWQARAKKAEAELAELKERLQVAGKPSPAQQRVLDAMRAGAQIGSTLNDLFNDYIEENLPEDLLAAYYDGFTVAQVANDLKAAIVSWANGYTIEDMIDLVEKSAGDFLDEDEE